MLIKLDPISWFLTFLKCEQLIIVSLDKYAFELISTLKSGNKFY